MSFYFVLFFYAAIFGENKFLISTITLLYKNYLKIVPTTTYSFIKVLNAEPYLFLLLFFKLLHHWVF